MYIWPFFMNVAKLLYFAKHYPAILKPINNLWKLDRKLLCTNYSQKLCGWDFLQGKTYHKWDSRHQEALCLCTLPLQLSNKEQQDNDLSTLWKRYQLSLEDGRRNDINQNDRCESTNTNFQLWNIQRLHTFSVIYLFCVPHNSKSAWYNIAILTSKRIMISDRF